VLAEVGPGQLAGEPAERDAVVVVGHVGWALEHRVIVARPVCEAGSMPSDLDFAAPLRDALHTAAFTYDRVAEAIGEDAHRALGRNETLPALRRTTSGGPLDTLVRLFLLQTPVARRAADRALPGLVDRLCNAGVLEQSVSEVAARTDCRPYAVSGPGSDRTSGSSPT
jgi:hypothetical protein